MAAIEKCSVCGSPMSADAPKGSCPVCLFQRALSLTTFQTPSQPSRENPEDKRDTLLGMGQVRRFAEYELIEEIGRGGMGVVYKARQASLDRVVALKMLMFGSLASADAIKRFRAEAATVASLQHPNIVAIHDVGVHADQHYLVMDYVEGPTLSHFVGEKPFEARRAAGYVKVIAEAVHFAHEQGILHRDLKPSNILVDANDQPRITDFGLAKRFGVNGDSARALTELTVTGHFFGSPSYMAPEQAGSKQGRNTRATDVYALGAILYHLVTGRPPFASEALANVLKQVLETEPLAPRLLNASVPADLETICLKCLQKEPPKRYPTAEAVAQELRRFLSHEPIQARPVSQIERAGRWCRRRPAVAGLTGVTLILLLAVLIGSPIALRRIASARLLAEQQLYAADMNLAHQAWEEGYLEHAQALLKAHVPSGGRPDLRGFEWRYLSELCRDESRYSFGNFSGSVGGLTLSRAGEVGGLALSQDGLILAGAESQGIKLLDVLSGRELFELPEPGSVPSVAFLPGERRLASTGAHDHKIRLWDLAKRQATIVFDTGRDFDPAHIAVSPDGKWLAAIDSDKSLQVWDIANEVKAWERKTAIPVLAIIFTKDSAALLSGGGEAGNVLVWESSSGKQLPAFPLVHTGWVAAFAFSNDGQKLATGGNDGRLVVWDFEKRQPAITLLGHEGNVYAVAFTKDGRLLASAGLDSTVRVWDLASGKEKSRLRGHKGPAWWVGFSGEGGTVLSSGADSIVRVWDPQPSQSRNRLAGSRQWLYPVAISPDGHQIATMQTHTGLVDVWDVPTRSLITNLVGHTDIGVFTAFSPDGRLLATGSYDRTVRLWDTSNFGCIGILTNRFEAGSLAFTPDGKTLAVAGFTLNPLQETNRLTFWDLGSRQELKLLPEAAPLTEAVSFSENGRWLATGHFDGAVRLWDFRTRRLAAPAFPRHKGNVYSVAFSKDSSLLASSGIDSEIHIYDVTKGCLVRTLQSLSPESWCVSFAPDGRTLVSASLEGGICFWNLATGNTALRLRQQPEQATSVAFAPNGNLLVGCGSEGSVWLWPALPASSR